MKTIKTWATVEFIEGDAMIEATLNYQTNKYSLTHANNDENVTFNGGKGESMDLHFDRVKCISAALKYIKQELGI